MLLHLLGGQATVDKQQGVDDLPQGACLGMAVAHAGVLGALCVKTQKVGIVSHQHSTFRKSECQVVRVGRF